MRQKECLTKNIPDYSIGKYPSEFIKKFPWKSRVYRANGAGRESVLKDKHVDIVASMVNMANAL